MANEIYAYYKSGFTLYAIVWKKSDDKVNLAGTNNFETWVDGNILTYDVPMTDNGGDYFTVDFPATITNIDLDVFRVGVFLQAGGTPVIADLPIDQGEIFWQDGSEVDLGIIFGTNQTVVNRYNETTPQIDVIDESVGRL